jgi:hypothetical protein
LFDPGLLGTITGVFRLCKSPFQLLILHVFDSSLIFIFPWVLAFSDGLIQGSGAMLRSVFFIIIAIVVAFIGLGCWVAVELSTGRPFKYPIWLRLLRSFSDYFFTGIFFIPV